MRKAALINYIQKFDVLGIIDRQHIFLFCLTHCFIEQENNSISKEQIILTILHGRHAGYREIESSCLKDWCCNHLAKVIIYIQSF